MHWFRCIGERMGSPKRSCVSSCSIDGTSMDILLRIGDLWVRRYASPDPAALAAVAALTPATVVTGASEGLGFALARRIAREGRTIVLLARSVDVLTEAADSLRDKYPRSNVIAASLDVGEKDAPAKIDALLASHGLYLDVLVNNAGMIPVGPLACASDAELEQVMATNVVAPLALTREMLPLLRRAAPSRVVNVGSMFGDIPYPLFAAYSASKCALRGLSIALRRELKSYGVGVTYASPRATRTNAADAMAPLAAPMQMRFDEPTRVAAQIWRAVTKDADSAYGKGPERLFVLLQRLLPKFIDRAVAAQMADTRVQDYLGQRYEAARAEAHAGQDIQPAPTRSPLMTMTQSEPAAVTSA